MEQESEAFLSRLRRREEFGERYNLSTVYGVFLMNFVEHELDGRFRIDAGLTNARRLERTSVRPTGSPCGSSKPLRGGSNRLRQGTGLPLFVEETIRADEQKSKERSFQEGREAGIEEGKAEGIEEGKTEGKKEVALQMKQNGISIETIAQCTGLSLVEIEELS